jgi:ferritin
MLSPDLESAMNTQIATELYSSHLYLAMSAYCEAEGLPGFATWFRMQSDEERGHALKFMRHVVDRGGRVMLTGMDAPAMDFGSPQGAFEQALAHEIDGLYGMAIQHGDYASQVFLQWFVTEQVEEERTATQIVQTLKNLGNDPASVLILDRELGARQAAG